MSSASISDPPHASPTERPSAVVSAAQQASSVQGSAPRKFNEHAIWIYGVLVGLAIEQALLGVAPYLLSSPDRRYSTYEAVRLAVFLIMVIRFYAGAVHHFSRESNGNVLSFLIGLLHFILFYLWALTIPLHPQGNTPPPADGLYLWGASIVLTYDLLWLVLTPSANRTGPMKTWTAVNWGTCALVALIYMSLTSAKLNWTHLDAEFAATSIIVLVSLVDVTEIARGKPIIRNWVLFWFHGAE